MGRNLHKIGINVLAFVRARGTQTQHHTNFTQTSHKLTSSPRPIAAIAASTDSLPKHHVFFASVAISAAVSWPAIHYYLLASAPCRWGVLTMLCELPTSQVREARRRGLFYGVIFRLCSGFSLCNDRMCSSRSSFVGSFGLFILKTFLSPLCIVSNSLSTSVPSLKLVSAS